MDLDKQVREQLVMLINWEDAHVGLDRALDELPVAARGQVPKGMAHSIWQIVEHMRIAQEDILEFSRNPKYKEKKWPDQYWPAAHAPADEEAWQKSIDTFHKEREAFCAMVVDPAQELFAPFPWGSGQTLMREALLIADHNAYHTGEIVAVRRALGVWEQA